MNIFEKIKQLLFGKKEIKELLEQTQVQSYREQNKNIIFRNDGTEFMLVPILDEKGEQLCEKVWSEYEKTGKNIPVFNVYSEELKQLSSNRNTYNGTRMLIDINPSDLQNSEFVEYLANNLLNKDRMEKIVTSCYNYAGKIQKSVTQGKITYKKWIDTSVIDHLSLSKEIRSQELEKEKIKRAEENIETMRKQAEKNNVNYGYNEDASKYNGDER